MCRTKQLTTVITIIIEVLVEEDTKVYYLWIGLEWTREKERTRTVPGYKRGVSRLRPRHKM